MLFDLMMLPEGSLCETGTSTPPRRGRCRVESGNRLFGDAAHFDSDTAGQGMEGIRECAPFESVAVSLSVCVGTSLGFVVARTAATAVW